MVGWVELWLSCGFDNRNNNISAITGVVWPKSKVRFMLPKITTTTTTITRLRTTAATKNTTQTTTTTTTTATSTIITTSKNTKKLKWVGTQLKLN